jgi:hypothetical protein
MLMTRLERLLRVLVDGQGTYSNYLNLLRQLSKGDDHGTKLRHMTKKRV